MDSPSRAGSSAEPEDGEPRAGRPKVKICGVTTPEDALLAVELGADLLGLNFYPPSPRFVDLARAREIATAVRTARAGADIPLVGVFVNAGSETVRRTEGEVGLDLLQFHGDETAGDLAPFAERALKVFRVRDRLDPKILEDHGDVWGVLVDSRHPSLFGGSGESWDFASLRSVPGATIGPRVFIAGGIDPSNVTAAIHAARPYGVDLCSGVESRPGHKDPRLMQRLFEEIDHGESPVTT